MLVWTNLLTKMNCSKNEILLTITVAFWCMAHAVYAARTFMFVGPTLPQLLYEKDQSSVIEEVYTNNRMMCAMKCIENVNCKTYLFKSTGKNICRTLALLYS